MGEGSQVVCQTSARGNVRFATLSGRGCVRLWDEDLAVPGQAPAQCTRQPMATVLVIRYE